MSASLDRQPQSVNGLTRRIIGCAYEVSNRLGVGFLEKVYENALVYELGRQGLHGVQQQRIAVKYRDVVVGDYVADIVVDDTVLVELKAIKALDEVHAAQCINYLAATNLPICLLLNFGKSKLGVKRFAGTNLSHR